MFLLGGCFLLHVKTSHLEKKKLLRTSKQNSGKKNGEERGGKSLSLDMAVAIKSGKIIVFWPLLGTCIIKNKSRFSF